MPEEATIPALQQAFREHRVTCHALVSTYLDRIAAYDKAGPKLNAILTLNPHALAQADALDAAFARHGATGPLYCVPVVLKDNYNTADLPTTGGSAALAGMQPAKDAFVVGRLRAAGAIVLAKSNMHEFALSGTTVSSLGGQTLNPYDLTRTPGGSSGGTGAAVAANLAMAGTGSDTVNSVRSPASANDLVGIRPTKGLLSLNGIMPVSSTQDAIGPIARHVVDAAIMLQVMAAADPADPATAGHQHPDYLAGLKAGALKGRRIGVLRVMFGDKPEHQAVNQVMAGALDGNAAAGRHPGRTERARVRLGQAERRQRRAEIRVQVGHGCVSRQHSERPEEDRRRHRRERPVQPPDPGEIPERGAVLQERHGRTGLQAAACSATRRPVRSWRR